jgi:hypothetical protein
MSKQYPIQVEDIPYNGPAVAKPAIPIRRGQTGVIKAAHASVALIWLIRSLAVALLLLSLFGTFYGMSGASMPLNKPGQVWIDIGLAKEGFILAIIVQVFFSVVQWGSMGLAKADVRWWGMYLIGLSFSAYWNWQAYHTAMIDVMRMPWLLALIIIVLSDILAEKALVL